MNRLSSRGWGEEENGKNSEEGGEGREESALPTGVRLYIGYSLLMTDAKFTELVTVKSDLPVRGEKKLTKKADKSYAKVLTQDTMGQSGVWALWILSKP